MPGQRLMFLYLGRRGAMTQFTLELARSAARAGRDIVLCISRQNELLPAYQELGVRLMLVDTFTSMSGVLLNSWEIVRIRRALQQRIRQDRIDAVVELMPHVWSPVIAPAIRSAGARYGLVVHDADRHDGDLVSGSKIIHDLAIPQADVVFTLSQFVAGKLEENGTASPARIRSLFHPDLYAGAASERRRRPGGPVRLLFFGRLLRYKGLSLFLDTIELLRRDGIAVQAGVFGSGSTEAETNRLAALGVEVCNRWLTHEEIPSVLTTYDAVVLSHLEASQSGVVAAALGLEIPVVVTPVGGLPEQVIDGKTGVVASRVEASALAEGVRRLFETLGLYDAIRRRIGETKASRSMDVFVETCIAQVLTAGPQIGGSPSPEELPAPLPGLVGPIGR